MYVCMYVCTVQDVARYSNTHIAIKLIVTAD